MSTDIAARIRAKFPLDEAVADVWAGKLNCTWCGRECPIIVGVRVTVGGYSTFFNLVELGVFEQEKWLCGILGREITGRHRIWWRWSEARKRDLLSNGCPWCDDILGEHLDIGEWACREKLGSTTVELDMMWRKALFEPGDKRERAKEGTVTPWPDDGRQL